ncbi:methyltransferase domain-containing protein [Nocardioidaceae bacterium]|nr:methyltransferase domain-containing protein [Nocardioidaceae bacterium]
MAEVPGQSPESVRAAYDTVADLYAARLPDLRAEAPLDLAMLDAFIDTVGPAANVLDAGCGTGRLSRHLVGRGLDASGIDLSPGMVAEASRSVPGVAFSVASLNQLPFGSGTFDGVLLWYSTIHTPRPEQPTIYREVARVLRPGGHLLVGFQSGTGERELSPRPMRCASRCMNRSTASIATMTARTAVHADMVTSMRAFVSAEVVRRRSRHRSQRHLRCWSNCTLVLSLVRPVDIHLAKEAAWRT